MNEGDLTKKNVGDCRDTATKTLKQQRALIPDERYISKLGTPSLYRFLKAYSAKCYRKERCR